MNEEEKKAIELLKKDCLVTSQQIKDGELFMIEDEEKMRISATQVLLNLIEKQQKEIEDLKTITRTYEAYKLGEGNKIMIASKEWFNDGYFEENFISKDKIKEIIKNHKKFLSNEFSKYSEDDIENRKAIQYASARLSFLLADIYKLGE